MATKNGRYRVTANLSKKNDAELVLWMNKKSDKELILRRALTVLKTIDDRTDNALVVELTTPDGRPIPGAKILPHVMTEEGWALIASMSTDDAGRIYLLPPRAKLALEVPNQVAIGNPRYEVHVTGGDPLCGAAGWVPIKQKSGLRVVKLKVPIHELGKSVITMLDDSDAVEIPNEDMTRLAQYTLRKMVLEEMLEDPALMGVERTQRQRNLNAVLDRMGRIYQDARYHAIAAGKKVSTKKRAK